MSGRKPKVWVEFDGAPIALEEGAASYDFRRCADGEHVVLPIGAELNWELEIGDMVEIEGERFERIPFVKGPEGPGIAVSPNLHVIGYSQPPHTPGADAYMDEHTGKVSQDPSGIPLWDSERSLNQTAKDTKGEVTHKRLR